LAAGAVAAAMLVSQMSAFAAVRNALLARVPEAAAARPVSAARR
jgi:hypothetical protein